MKIFQKGKLKKLERPFRADSGAWVLFEGTVRSPNNNKKVRFINYEVYEEMLESEGSKIAKQAEGKWDVKEIIIKHGSGKIKPEERSIQSGILAPHRKEAFKAAEWVLEECKKRLPVWKEEIN